MKRGGIVIPLQDSGYVSVSLEDFGKKVKETGSDLKARQYFLRNYER